MLEISGKRITLEGKDILENKVFLFRRVGGGRSVRHKCNHLGYLSSRNVHDVLCPRRGTVICSLMFPVWRAVHTLGRDTRIASVCLAEDGQDKGISFTTSAEPRLGNQLPWGRKKTSEAMRFLAFRFTVQARDVDSLEKLLWFHSSPSKKFTEQRREFTSLSGFPLG